MPAAAATKQIRFEYTGMEAYAKEISPGWEVQDFAAGIGNPNPDTIWVQVSFISDDPNYVIDCPHVTGGCSAYYGPREISGYTPSNPWIGTNWNFMNVSFPGVQDNRPFQWTGTVIIESIDYNGISAKPFYSFDPHLFTIRGSSQNSLEDAYFKGWDVWGSDIPTSWDPDQKVFFTSYGNFWHNWPDWPNGWQTKMTLTNNKSVPVTFTVRNHLYSGFQGTAQHLCPTGPPIRTQDMLVYTYTLQPGAQKTIDVFRDGLSDAEIAAHSLESVLTVEPSISDPSSLSVSVRVSPNAAGKWLSCDPKSPTIHFTSPADDSTVSGTVPVTVYASDWGSSRDDISPDIKADDVSMGSGVAAPFLLSILIPVRFPMASIHLWRQVKIVQGTKLFPQKFLLTCRIQMLVPVMRELIVAE